MVMSTPTRSAHAYRREAAERDGRALCNRLAVQCQAGIRSIEAMPHWRCSPELRHWWAALCQARTALSQSPPEPEPSRVEREIAEVIDALGAAPAESPPAGGGGGDCGGATTWAELLGAQ